LKQTLRISLIAEKQFDTVLEMCAVMPILDLVFIGAVILLEQL